MAKKWIQNSGMQKGKLHRRLGVPEDQTIPDTKLQAAAHSPNTSLRREAVLAQTLKHLHRGR